MRSRAQEALCHFNAGMTHQQHGCLDGAKAAYLRAIKAGKSLATAHNNLGVVCLRLEEYASAAKHFHEEVELEPPRPCPVSLLLRGAESRTAVEPHRASADGRMHYP